MEVISRSGGGSTVVDLGTGTSFDIKTLAPDLDYVTLTDDDFYVKPSGRVSTANTGVWGSGCSSSQTVGVTSLTASIALSYNASTGVLSSYLTASASGGDLYSCGWATKTASQSVAVHAYLIRQ